MIHLLQCQDHMLGLAYLDMSHLGISDTHDIHVLAYLMTHDGNDIWQTACQRISCPAPCRAYGKNCPPGRRSTSSMLWQSALHSWEPGTNGSRSHLSVIPVPTRELAVRFLQHSDGPQRTTRLNSASSSVPTNMKRFSIIFFICFHQHCPKDQLG
jgi:hypothetical protein